MRLEMHSCSRQHIPQLCSCSLGSLLKKRINANKKGAPSLPAPHPTHPSTRHKSRKHDYWGFLIFNTRADTTDVAITEIPLFFKIFFIFLRDSARNCGFLLHCCSGENSNFVPFFSCQNTQETKPAEGKMRDFSCTVLVLIWGHAGWSCTMYVCMYVYTTIYFSRLLQLFLTDSYPLLLFNINTALNTDMVLSWNAIRKAGLEGDVASSWLLHIKIPSHTASTDVLLVHWFLFVVRKCTLSLKRDPHPQPTLISKTQWRVQNLVKFV